MKNVEDLNIDKYIDIQKTKGVANIELTYRCPLQCSQCIRSFLTTGNEHQKKYIKQKILESNDISLDEFKKLCNFFKSSISLCGQFSDPIYHKNFYEILKICSNDYADQRFRIHTAAHQRNLNWYKKAFELTGKNITWIFGIDGLPETSALYRKNQNSQLVFDAMLMAKQMEVNVIWQFIVFNFNENQIEEAKTIAKEKDIKFRLVYTDRTIGDQHIISKNFKPKGPVKEFIECI